jgi:hypothetical protein
VFWYAKQISLIFHNSKMSLLREIQNEAIKSDTNIATLLRKCKVLAARLGSEEFGIWVKNELSGYESIDELPDYRVLHVNSKGKFSSYHWIADELDIPLHCIPQEYREKMSIANVIQPVVSIEALVLSANGHGSAQEPWNPSFVSMVGKNIYQHANCFEAWKVIPINALVAILDEVRNRIVDFVLKIEAENPEAGEAALNSNPVPPEKVAQIFNTTINGNVGNIATGSHHFGQTSHNDTNVELFDNLLAALKAVQEQIPDQEIIAAIYESINKMRATQNTDNFKDHYLNFMSFLSNHITVLGAATPYLPALAQLLTK